MTLLTDASRHHGMGFALCQEVNGAKAIITCGSKSFTPAQQRYATIELECLAIIWAVQKCELYLKGLPDFTVATDHRPLVGTFNKGISELTNPMLQRLHEKVSGYSAYRAPMAHVGLDLFDYAVKKHLICVDKWSGYLVRVAPDCNRSYCEDSFSGYSGSV